MNGCPKCGGTEGYWLNVRAVGIVTHRGRWDVPGGDEKIVNDDGLRFVADKSVRCIECNLRTITKNLRHT